MVVMFIMAAMVSADPNAPTPLAECRKVIEFMCLDKNDVLYDLGCGDGRMCVLAVESSGCRAVGVDVQEMMVMQAKAAARMHFVQERTAFYHQDVLDIQLDKLPATVFYLYLPQDLVKRLTPRLKKCRGVRIVSYMHELDCPSTTSWGDWHCYEF